MIDEIPKVRRKHATNPNLPVVHAGVPGRPPYDDVVRQRILARIRIGGVPRTVAAMAEGVDGSMMTDWTRRYPEFAKAVAQAEAHAHAAVATNLRRLTFRNPQAALGWLERRYPDTWKQRIEVTTEPTPDREIADSDLTTEEIDQWIAARERERGQAPGSRPEGDPDPQGSGG